MTAPAAKPTPALPQAKPGILEIAPYKPGKSAAGTQRVMKLSSNENPLGASPKAVEAYQNAAVNLNRYPDGGASALRDAIAETYGMDASRIVCGAGSDELIGLLIHAYAGIGDEVLYSEHGFLMYKIYAQGFGVTPVTAKEKNLTADIDALLAAVTPDTKIVFIANPNNPTGSYISAEALSKLRRGLPENVILAVDAAYAEYVEEQDYSDGRRLVEVTENTVMLRTFSKIHGLSALRLGWAYCPLAIADVLNRVRGPFNVSTPSMQAGIAAIRDEEFADKTRAFNKQWREWLAKELTALSLHVYPSVTNFILVRFPAEGKTADAANRYLMERGIIPREVGAYGLGESLRISIGLEEENRAVAETLGQFMRA